MSKLARKPIDISNVEVTYEQRNLSIKGKHGQLEMTLVHGVELEVTNDHITVTAVKRVCLRFSQRIVVIDPKTGLHHCARILFRSP